MIGCGTASILGPAVLADKRHEPDTLPDTGDVARE